MNSPSINFRLRNALDKAVTLVPSLTYAYNSLSGGASNTDLLDLFRRASVERADLVTEYLSLKAMVDADA